MKAGQRRRISPFVLVWAVVILVGIWFSARKVWAESPHDRGASARGSRVVRVAARFDAPGDKGGKAIAPPASAAPLASAAPPVSAASPPEPPPPPKAEGKDEPKTIYDEDPVDYAVAGPDGGVPLHADGRFRSPFAHPKFGNPAKVRVGVVLSNVREYDIQKGTFEADFFLTLTSEAPMPNMDLIFTNGKSDMKEVMADKPTFKMYRFIGTFSSPADLHDYPFDTQELVIEVEDDDNGVDQVELVPDQEHTNLDINFEVPGWETAFTKARVFVHNFPDRFDNDDLYYSRYQFSLGLRRYGTSAVFTVFVPAIVIVLISLTGLWITRDELEVRSNATTPMLAAAVLFHYALIQSLPATPYLTRADKLMLSVYIILGLHMLASLFWFFFDDKHTDRIFHLARAVGVPVTFVILACGMFL